MFETLLSDGTLLNETFQRFERKSDENCADFCAFVEIVKFNCTNDTVLQFLVLFNNKIEITNAIDDQFEMVTNQNVQNLFLL